MCWGSWCGTGPCCSQPAASDPVGRTSCRPGTTPRPRSTGRRGRYCGGSGHQRIAALSTAAQGHAQFTQGHIEQACATWGRALDGVTGVRSTHTRVRTCSTVMALLTDLARLRGRGVRSVLAPGRPRPLVTARRGMHQPGVRARWPHCITSERGPARCAGARTLGYALRLLRKVPAACRPRGGSRCPTGRNSSATPARVLA